MKFTGLLPIAAACGVLSLLSTAGASAANYEMVYVGTVDGEDTEGLFGTPGADLNTTFKEVFTVNTSAGDLSSSATSQNISGGTQYNLSDPVTGTLTINGVTVSIGASSYYGMARVEANPSASSGEVSDEAEDKKVIAGGYQEISLQSTVISSKTAVGFPAAFGAHYGLTVDGSSIVGGGEYSIMDYVGTTDTSLEDLTLTPTSAAPEPATWAFLIVGVCVVGGMLRSARRHASPLAA